MTSPLLDYVEAPCPECEFPLEVQLADIVAQVYRWCPCCRVRIHFIDETGSVASGLARADSLLKGLFR